MTQIVVASSVATTNRSLWVAPELVLFGVAALALRLRDIERAFWLDEAYSLWFARLSWSALWSETPDYETHPPLYYSLLKLLLPFGEGEVALRLPSVAASLLVLPLVWRLLSDLRHRAGRDFAEAAMMAPAFIGLSAAHIHFGQEARPYALLVLSATLLLLLASRWLQALEERKNARPFVVPVSLLAGLALAGGLTCWLHAVAGLYVAAVMLPLGVVALAHPQRWRALAGLVLVAMTILLLILPYLGFLAERGGDWSKDTWMSPLTPYRARNILQNLLLPLPIGGWLGTLLLLLLLPLMAKGAVMLRRLAGWPHALLLTSAAVLPVLVALMMAFTVAPVFSARTMLPATVPIFIILAVGCQGLLRGGAAAILALALAWGAIAGDPSKQDEPYDLVASALIAQAGAADPILVVTSDVAIPLGIYLERAGVRLNLRPMPAPFPALGLPNRYPYGSPGLPESSAGDIARAVAETNAEPVVWLLDRYEQTPMLRAALVAARPIDRETHFGPALRLTRFGPPSPR